MCTYVTLGAKLDGSAKGPNGSWFHITDASVYVDHPVHALAEHTLNIDFVDPANGPSAAGRGRVDPRLGTGAPHGVQGALDSAQASPSLSQRHIAAAADVPGPDPG